MTEGNSFFVKKNKNKTIKRQKKLKNETQVKQKWRQFFEKHTQKFLPLNCKNSNKYNVYNNSINLKKKSLNRKVISRKLKINLERNLLGGRTSKTHTCPIIAWYKV